jgi:Flp pilus assembly protein TadG
MRRIMLRHVRIVTDRAGTAAVEFALIMPLLVTLFFGSYEISNLLLADMKLTAAAQTAADLMARTPSTTAYLQATDFTANLNAVQQVMTPLPTTGSPAPLKVAYASITYNTGTPVVDWHNEQNSATVLTTTSINSSLHSPLSLTSLGNDSNASSGSTDSLVVVSIQYTYTSPISYVLNRTWTLSEIAFARPRYLACVSIWTQTNQNCP